MTRPGPQGAYSEAAGELVLTMPDDWHLHLRDGPALSAVIGDTARRFGRAIIMPNLVPPVTTVLAAQAYRQRILAARPAGSRFEPLMTLYLTESTPTAEIDRARDSGFIHGVKYYPAGATTHSEAGVRDLAKCGEILDALEKSGLPLQVHGEVTDPAVDIFDREQVFLETVLDPLLKRHQGLRVVLEHITTASAVAFVLAASERVAATVTAHHLLYSRNAMFTGGIRPHWYCLPILKRDIHRQALLRAVTSGSPRFFLGTDSAPHSRSAKESACGCAGIYSAHAAIEFYAEAFEAVGALDKLEAFASFHGPDYYGLPRNAGRLTLARQPQAIPPTLPFPDDVLIPLRAGESVAWTVLP